MPDIKPKVKHPPLTYSDKLYNIIVKIYETGSDVALELLDVDDKSLDNNLLDIELVDISKQDWSVDVKSHGKISQMKIGMFVRYLFPKKFKERDIFMFATLYNKLRKGESIEEKIKTGTIIDVPSFSLNPKDVRSTFISLVTSTYPNPNEDQVVKYLPQDLTKDKYGNYYKIIGTSETMFTCHLDTADSGSPKKVVLYNEMLESNKCSVCDKDHAHDWPGEFISTDQETILGADDKAGVSVLMYMMAHDIPGVYYFFIGEERGGIGSSEVAFDFLEIEHLKGMKRCISFDRKNYFSIITHQLGDICCSDVFAKALCEEYNKNGMKMGLDSTGVYTDSANFTNLIPECTNISIGYFHEHTRDEILNMTYLIKLAESSIKVNWESLPSNRKVGFDPDILKKYGDIMYDIREMKFASKYRFSSEEGQAFLNFCIDDIPAFEFYNDLMALNILFEDYKMDPDIYFYKDEIKIQFK